MPKLPNNQKPSKGRKTKPYDRKGKGKAKPVNNHEQIGTVNNPVDEEDVKIHERTCDHCGYIYARKSGLTRHLKKVNGEGFEYVCTYKGCRAVIPEFSNFLIHYRSIQ